MELQNTVNTILKNAADQLATAKLGLADFLDPSRIRRDSGLRNLITFGRSVTWVLQNLTNKTTDFEGWYTAKQAEMKENRLFPFMRELRNRLEKRGEMNTYFASRARISSDVISSLPKPAGASSFFICDSIGGSGWTVKLSDESEVKFYIELPESMGNVNQYFEAELIGFPEFRNQPVEEIVQRYMSYLEGLVAEATAKFKQG